MCAIGVRHTVKQGLMQVISSANYGHDRSVLPSQFTSTSQTQLCTTNNKQCKKTSKEGNPLYIYSHYKLVIYEISHSISDISSK